MTEISELREKVHDMQVNVARLEERVSVLITSVDSLATRMNPIAAAVQKGKGYVAAVAIVCAVIGGGVRELFGFWRGGGS